jgi:hypothetical protein
MVRLRLQCVMSILLGSTGMLIAQQQPLPQGRLPRTVPAPLTSTQPSNPNTAPQQGVQTAPAAQGAVRIAAPAPTSQVAKPAVKAKQKAGKTKQEMVQAQPAPPPPPPTMEQMPAQPPQVRFAGGLLTVEAKNSTLGDVLTAIRRQTGASLEIPPGAGSERIMAHLGPGQPREVIVSLLNGSNFDYIILGSLQRPGGLDKIILTARQNQAGGGPPPAVAQNPGLRPGQQPVVEDSEGEGGEAPDREVENSAEPEPEQPQPEQQPAQPQGVPGPQPGAPGQPPAQQQAQPEGEGQPQVKTPEQLLRELQQMRQQQQQQQQNQGENPQPPQDTPNNPPQ